MDGDVVGRSVALWAEQMPELDVSASEVLARILRIAQHVEGAENARLRRRHADGWWPTWATSRCCGRCGASVRRTR